MNKAASTPNAVPQTTGESALVELAKKWSAPAIALDAAGRVIAASSQSGITNGMSPPFRPPEGPGPALAKDATGRQWRLSQLVDGERIAIADANTGLDAETRFTAAVSHEIRTPLNGILGMTALLEEGELSPAQKEYASAIRSSGARLLDLLNNILDYSRIEAGDVPLEYAPFSPADLVQGVAELLAPRAHAAGLDLAAVVEPELATQLVGDAGRLRQILFNLAGNAVKFTESGGILISARRSRNGEGVAFVVCDTGRGIPDEARERLFEAFSQTRADDSTRDGGVGLGLAIVAQLVRAMKGRITVQSQPGQGAAFRVDIPLFPAAGHGGARQGDADLDLDILLDLPPASRVACAMAAASQDARVYVRSSTGPRQVDVTIADAALPPAQITAMARANPTLVVLRPEDRSRIPQFREMGCAGYLIRPLRAQSIIARVGLAMSGEVVEAEDELVEAAARPHDAGRVLIADDNAVNTLLASRALTSAGFRVDTAGTGAEALERAGEVEYDVIFMDIRMPVMDGLEATRRIRRLPGSASTTPIVAITADINPELEGRAEAAGINQLAAKPIDPLQLRKLAELWTGSRAQAAE